MADPLISVVRTSGGGSQGPKGDPGATGPAGPPVFIPGEDGEEGQSGIPGPVGPQGASGAAGGTGAQGPVGPAVFLEAEAIEGEAGPPGVRGADGAAGSAGQTGSQGPTGPAVFLEAEQGEPGDQGPPGAPGVIQVTVTEQDFGAAQTYYGEFTVTDASVTASSQILVQLISEAPAALRDGVAADGDEADMEPMVLRAIVAAGSFTLVAEVIDGPVTGPYKFGYVVG